MVSVFSLKVKGLCRWKGCRFKTK